VIFGYSLFWDNTVSNLFIKPAGGPWGWRVGFRPHRGWPTTVRPGLAGLYCSLFEGRWSRNGLPTNFMVGYEVRFFRSFSANETQQRIYSYWNLQNA